MSTTELGSLRDELLIIPVEEVKTPIIPVSVYIQEAEDQKVIAERDKEKLISHGLDWTYVETLPARAGALREAQSLWMCESKSREDAEKEWMEKAPKAFQMRDDLLDAFRYAYRKQTDLLTNVTAIAEGNSRDDMIQDLNDLAVLGKANTDLLEQINFNLDRLDLAATTSDEMASLLAAAKGERLNETEEFVLRNRAYTYLKQAVDEIRHCGKYTFADDNDTLKGYRSEYLHKVNRKQRFNDNNETE